MPKTLNSCIASLLKSYSDVPCASFWSSSFAQIRYSFSDNNLSGYSTILSYDSNFDIFILPSFHLFQKQIQVLTFQKICFYLHQEKLFKNYKKCFLFHVKSPFISSDTSLMRDLKLISKFMTPQARKEISTLHMLPNVSHVAFYWLTKFHHLVVITSWDIGQYVHCNCLFPRFWRHKFWYWPYISNQAVFLNDKNVRQKFKYLENEKSF